MSQRAKTLSIEQAALAYERAGRRAKAAYKMKDAMLDIILLGTSPGDVIETPKGSFVLKNQFADKHKAYKTTHFEQFELVRVK